MNAGKVIELNRKYLVAFTTAIGLNTNDYGKLTLPMNQDMNFGYDYLTLRPDRSFRNIGFFVFPTAEIRSGIDFLELVLKFGFIYRDTTTKMRQLELDENKQIITERYYSNRAVYSAFNVQIGLTWEF